MEINIDAVVVKNNRIRTGLWSDDHYARVKKSIASIGLKNPIMINENRELVNGLLRLKIYKELHQEELDKLRYIKSLPDEKERDLLVKKFGSYIYDKISYEVIETEQEKEDLKNELLESWYMREYEGYKVSTALDRLNILYDDRKKFLIELSAHLNTTQEEIESFLKIGEDIRNGQFDKIKVLLYKNKSITSDALYNIEKFEEQIILEEEEEIEEVIEEFDLGDWL